MNLRTSFFNKSVIKSDFKRFWWISGLEALGIFVMFTFLFLNRARFSLQSAEAMFRAFKETSTPTFVLACMFPVGLSALIFNYLNSSSQVACLHGLPIKRRTFFASHFLSGSILLIIPALINAIILLCFKLDSSISEYYRVIWVLQWFGTNILYNILVFAGATMVMMICGNSIAGIVFTYIFAFLPVCAESFIQYFLDLQVYGFDADFSNPVSAFLYVSPYNMYESILPALKYIAFTAVFTGIAYLLYKFRKLERNGEIVAFSKLRKVFTYGVAICSGAVGFSYFNAIWNISSIFLLIPFGVLGIIIAEMILKKSMRVPSAIKPVILYVLGVLVLYAGITFDVTGYERRIPAIETIESIEFDNGINNYHYSYRMDGEEVVYENEDALLYSTEDITNVVRLHEELVSNRTDEYFTGRNTFTSNITYKLKNGKEIKREYLTDYDIHKEFLEPVIESEVMRKKYFPILKEIKKNIEKISIYDERIGKEVTFYADDISQINAVVEALKKDAQNTDYDLFASRGGEFGNIRITYYVPAKYEDGSEVPREKLSAVSETYYIRSDYENIINLLNEMNYYDNLPKPENITEMEVEYYTSYEFSSFHGKEKATTIEIDGRGKKITDRGEIEILCRYINEVPKARIQNGSLIVKMSDGYSFGVPFHEDDENCPQILKRNTEAQ